MSKVKIINPIFDAKLSDGTDFPFTPSTQLYPEWNFAARPQVDKEIAQRVQHELLMMQEYASLRNSDANCTNVKLDVMRQARRALESGSYAGWRSTLSYIQLRLMQEDLGITSGETCVHSTNIAEAVVCPEGFFRKNDEDISNGCVSQNLDCYGFQCLCSPCQTSFEVAFAPENESVPCSKFDICGQVEQGDSITYIAVDNKRREDARLSVRVIEGKDHVTFSMRRIPETNQYEFIFDADQREVGITILEVYLEGEQLLQSPFRLEVVERDCKGETGNLALEPDTFGNCVCGNRTIPLRDRCVGMEWAISLILGIILVVVAISVKYYVDVKHNEASFWKINPKELVFPAEPVFLGTGKFGVVLQAQYRGSSVAVKRVFSGSLSDDRSLFLVAPPSPFEEYERINGDEASTVFKRTASSSQKVLMKQFREEMLVLSRLR